IPEFDAWELGEPLIWRIQWDWGVFDEDYLSEDKQVELLEDIVNSNWDDDDGEPPIDPRDIYMKGSIYHTPHTDLWSEFVSEVRRNREAELPFYEYLEESLGRAETMVPAGKVYYRARRGCDVDEDGGYEPYCGNAIAAPAPEIVEEPGRANYQHESF